MVGKRDLKFWTMGWLSSVPPIFGNVTQVSIRAAKRIQMVVPTTIPQTYRHILTELVEKTNENIVTTEPTKDTLSERESRLYYDGAKLWIYVKRNNTIYRTQLNPK